jgi:hypothetical protein
VAAPQEAGPTPTPRLIALATAVPATEVPPQPTLPPAVPVESVPVVALAPVEMAPPPAPTATSRSPEVIQPTPVPVEVDDDPFNIFDDGEGTGIVPAQNDALERARALQGGGNTDRDSDNPVIVPAPVIRDDAGPDRPGEVAMPDVDAMIDEITARATDPNRNPNVGNAGRGNSARDNEDDDREEVEPRENRRKSARERINERNRNRAPTSNSRSARDPVIPDVPVIVPRDSGNDGQECEDPFASLPEDMRPQGFPFNNC